MARARPQGADSEPPAPPGAQLRAVAWSRRARTFCSDAVAVSPVVGTILILAISAIGVAAVMTWGVPGLQQTQADTEFTGSEEQFRTFDQITESVMRGGAVGKASQASFTVPEGSFQLRNDTLLVVSWHPNTAAADGSESFWLGDLHDADDQSLRVVAGKGQDPTAAGAAQYLSVHRVDGVTETAIPECVPPAQVVNCRERSAWHTVSDEWQMVGTNYESSIKFSEDINVYDTPIRVRVMEPVSNLDDVVMEAWILPLGSFEYTRQTPYGVVGLRLENSVVVREMETGDFLTSRPLVTLENDASGDPQFLALFAHRLVDNPRLPGVSGAGAGSYPVLFSLQGNNLRTSGDEVYRVGVNVTGDRADLWHTQFRDAYDFVDTSISSGTDKGLQLDSGASTFDFVLMQTDIEVSLDIDIQDLGAPTN